MSETVQERLENGEQISTKMLVKRIFEFFEQMHKCGGSTASPVRADRAETFRIFRLP